MGNTDKIFDLSASLFDDTVLASKDDTHPTEVSNFRSAHHQGIDVETSTGKNPGHARQHSGLVLNETIENVPISRGTCIIGISSTNRIRLM